MPCLNQADPILLVVVALVQSKANGLTLAQTTVGRIIYPLNSNSTSLWSPKPEKT